MFDGTLATSPFPLPILIHDLCRVWSFLATTAAIRRAWNVRWWTVSVFWWWSFFFLFPGSTWWWCSINIPIFFLSGLFFTFSSINFTLLFFVRKRGNVFLLLLSFLQLFIFFFSIFFKSVWWWVKWRNGCRGCWLLEVYFFCSTLTCSVSRLLKSLSLM